MEVITSTADPRLLSAARSQLGRAARPGPRGSRSLRAALRVPLARHVARGVRLRAGRRRIAAGGGDPVLLRGHPRHPAAPIAPPSTAAMRRSTSRTGVAAFARDLESSQQVWSAREGYPGDRHYRDFYRDIGFDLPQEYDRPVYSPGRPPDATRASSITRSPTSSYTTSGCTIPTIARQRAGRARGAFPDSSPAAGRALRGQHGSSPARRQPLRCGAVRSLVVRGPVFLGDLFRQLYHDQQAVPTDHARGLPRPAPDQPGRDPVDVLVGVEGVRRVLARREQRVGLPAPAQGRRADGRAGDRHPSATGITKRALNQAARELMLMQSSDWAFIMRTGTTVSYATRRMNEHRPALQSPVRRHHGGSAIRN